MIMKTRTGFVSNSSSSSFIITTATIGAIVNIMKLQDIPSPSQATRNQALRMVNESANRILAHCAGLGWLWSNGSKPVDITEFNHKWWLYLGDHKSHSLIPFGYLHPGFVGYDVDISEASSSPVSTGNPDICKQCGGFGRIIGMACICDNCGKLIWGC